MKDILFLIYFVIHRYSLGKIGGAIVILAGAFVALIPLFLNSHGSNDPPAKWYSILIYVSNNIPQVRLAQSIHSAKPL